MYAPYPRETRNAIETFMDQYVAALNSHSFAKVDPFIADDAVIWYSDASINGKVSLQTYMEGVWRMIPDEVFSIYNRILLHFSSGSATYCYTYRYAGHLSDGTPIEGEGRGTSFIKCTNGRWTIGHIHLSPNPPIEK